MFFTFFFVKDLCSVNHLHLMSHSLEVAFPEKLCEEPFYSLHESGCRKGRPGRRTRRSQTREKDFLIFLFERTNLTLHFSPHVLVVSYSAFSIAPFHAFTGAFAIVMSLFHAGGAAHHFPLPDGLGILRSSLTRLQHLDLTQLGSIIALAGIVPAAWRYLRHAWLETGSWIRHFFVSSVTIPAGDACNRNVTTWLLDNVIQPDSMRFFTARTQVSSRDLEPGAALKKSTRAVQYIPHWNSTWFWHKSRLFVISRSLESLSSSLNDPVYDGIGGEELTISCLGLSADPIRDLIETCREFAEQMSQFYVIIYSRDRYGMAWRPKYRKPLRRLDTVHIDHIMKQNLVADIRNYLDPRTQKLYQSRSMPYRRGYLLEGPPGTGKSSLSAAIAGEFGLDLYELKVPSIGSDADLEQAFQEIPPRCIVLLEDIDCVWARDQHVERLHHDTDSNSNSSSNVPNVTLSGLLNVLDGVGSQEGRVVIMTTNKLDRLDGALIRPGRIDLKIHLGHISAVCAEEMFLRMFQPELLSWARSTRTVESDDPLDEYVSAEQIKFLAKRFASAIPERTFTPSQLQGFFQLHLSSAVEAAESIEDWVKREADGGSLSETHEGSN